MAIAQSTAPNTSSFKLRVSFFDNPGKLYNAGNIVALGVGLLDCMVLSQAKLGATFAALNNFFIGSWPAIFTSLAVIFFFINGQKYASAWANGYPPNVHDNKMGDGLSGLGAILIGVGLIGFSQGNLGFYLAIITTLLHAGGKFGSFANWQSERFFKILPFVSRATYILALVATLFTSIEPWHEIVPWGLIAAAMIWARADWLLCPKSPRNKI